LPSLPTKDQDKEESGHGRGDCDVAGWKGKRTVAESAVDDGLDNELGEAHDHRRTQDTKRQTDAIIAPSSEHGESSNEYQGWERSTERYDRLCQIE
jgi:hypothetical protein